MATIVKKKGKWFVQIRRSFHKPIYKTFSAKSDAHKWARETERSIELGQYVDVSEANKTTLRQLLERYGREVSVKKRSDTEKYQIKNLLTFDFVDKTLAQISKSDIAEFRDKRLVQVSGSSVNKQLSILSDCINKAITEWKCYVKENPVGRELRCKEPPPRTRRLEGDEYERLMIACKKSQPFWCPIIDFAIQVGMRRGELLKAEWSMVDMKKKIIALPASITKTLKGRNVPLQPKALEILRTLPRSLSGKIFPIGVKNFESSWRSICNKAKIEKHLRFHDLKRECVSLLLEKGLSISEVQNFVGNSLASLSIYTAHDSSAIAEKVKWLDDYQKNNPKQFMN